jgi:hypothetical protein
MQKVQIEIEGYECPLCLDIYPTAKEAESCREIDGADSFSKRAAWKRRQRNEEVRKKKNKPIVPPGPFQ